MSVIAKIGKLVLFKDQQGKLRAGIQSWGHSRGRKGQKRNQVARRRAANKVARASRRVNRQIAKAA